MRRRSRLRSRGTRNANTKQNQRRLTTIQSSVWAENEKEGEKEKKGKRRWLSRINAVAAASILAPAVPLTYIIMQISRDLVLVRSFAYPNRPTKPIPNRSNCFHKTSRWEEEKKYYLSNSLANRNSEYQKNLRATTFSIFRLYGKNGKMYGINNLFRILFTSGTALIQITSIVRYALLRPQTWTKFMKILTDTKIGKKNRKKI